MRNIGVLLVLLYVAYSSLAQNIVTSDDYIPYSGDIVIKEQLLHADAGNGGESCFWDFADMPVVSDEYKISYSGDSVLTSLTPKGIYKYVCDNDKLLLIRFETPLLFIDYNIPVTQMKYPMAYGDTASFSFSGTGKYCNFYDVKCHGHMFFEADGLGDILLVENDTLTDALRVHIVKECDISMNIPGDSTDTSDDIKREKEEFYIWYAKGCRYFQTPVQESAEKYHILRYNSGKILGPSQGDVVYSCSKTLVNTWRLSKISWNSGTVIFESSARDDEKGIIDSTNPQKLSTIKVYDKKGSVIKEVDFNYSYFNDSYVGKYPHVFKRLKLTGISNAADRNCNYKFDYYDGAFPAKNSKNTDYWGYSNGINQGANYYCPMVYNNVYYEGADKSSNFNYMLIGTLKSVVSPTKGKTTFVYEANRYKVTPNTALVTHNIKEGINVFNEYNYDTYNQYPKTVKHEFTLSVNTQMKIYGFAENEGCIEDKDVRYDHDDNATFKISKLKSDGSKQLIFYYPTPSEMRTDCSYTFPTKTIELPKGNFIIEAEAHAKDTWYAFFYEYNKTETVVSDSVITGGGLRIKSIAGAENKTYEYEDGKLLIDPIFGNERRVATYEFIASQLKYIWYSTDYLVQQSEASIPMSTMKAGNIFGYSSVTERMGNVTTTHYYYNEREREQNDNNPYTPTVYNAFNGIEKKTVTDKSIIEYDYVTRKANAINAFIFNAETNEIYPYTYEIEYPLLSKVTKTMNESNGTVKTNNTYTYNKNFMKETESINDVDAIYTKKYVYPDSADIHIFNYRCR